MVHKRGISYALTDEGLPCKDFNNFWSRTFKSFTVENIRYISASMELQNFVILVHETGIHQYNKELFKRQITQTKEINHGVYLRPGAG
ncbi:hypothetical protein SHINM1_005190 [Fluviibacter phosphoraccumulans]|nr:hypothetical protein SHINM1_005190 [Fluviibacter phosphoraccumulans]